MEKSLETHALGSVPARVPWGQWGLNLLKALVTSYRGGGPRAREGERSPEVIQTDAGRAGAPTSLQPCPDC